MKSGALLATDGSMANLEGSHSSPTASMHRVTTQQLANIASWSGFRWIINDRDPTNVSAAKNTATDVIATMSPPADLARLNSTKKARKPNGKPHNRLRWNLR